MQSFARCRTTPTATALKRREGIRCSRKTQLLVTAAASQQAAATDAPAQTHWFQKTITLPNHKRGCHVVTRKILAELPELGEYEVGLANLFILHTSASLTINENASPDVPLDLNHAGCARQVGP